MGELEPTTEELYEDLRKIMSDCQSLMEKDVWRKANNYLDRLFVRAMKQEPTSTCRCAE